MLNIVEKEMLFLYHSHFVCITLNNGKCHEGIVTEIDDNTITVDKDIFVLEDLSDIEYIGFLTDFHTYNNFGEIDEVYTFEMPDVIDEELIEMVKYHEHHCRVKCHLHLQDKICAKDVKIMESMHVLNQEVLSGGNFLYTMKDGSRKVGTLVKGESGYELEYNGYTTCNFVQTQVVDITRIPTINDYVMVIKPDGTVHQGLVSAVREDGFNVLENKSLKIIAYADMEQLRYFGELTSDQGMIDEKYKCKLPHYLHDAEEEERIREPHAKLTYVVGVNDRGQIAKDVMISDNESITQSVKWYIGLVFFYKTSVGGFVGDRYVASGCGDQTCNKVYFKVAQFPVAYESNKIYLVKYTIAKMRDETGKSVISRMQVLERYDRENIASIQIEEDGTTKIERIYRRALFRYKGRNVEILLQNAEKKTGILTDYDKDEKESPLNGGYITLTVEKDGEQRTERIPYEDIVEIRTSGTITKCDPGDVHARVDGIYILYKRDVLSENERGRLAVGARVSFVIRNKPDAENDNERWLDCKQIKVLQDEVEEVYVTAYANNIYTVIARADYDTEKAKAYEIHATLKNPFAELDKYDYPARFTKRNENGKDKYVSVNGEDEAPKVKKFKGYVSAFDENTVTIASEQDYFTTGDKKVYDLARPSSDLQRKKAGLKVKDYLVEYKLIETGVEILRVLKQENKRYLGYLVSNSEELKNWYISPVYEDRSTDTNTYEDILVSCRYGELKFSEDIRKSLELATEQVTPDAIHKDEYKYKVLYTLKQFELKKGKRYAKTAAIIEMEKKPVVQKEMSCNVNIDLSEAEKERGLRRDAGVEYVYGILTLHPKKMTHFKILDSFQGSLDMARAKTLAVVINDAEKNHTVQLNDNGMTRNKKCYVVRFVMGETTEEGVREIDYNYPIDFIKEYPTKDIRDEIRIEGNQLVGTVNMIVPVGSVQKLKNSAKEAPGYTPGESILYKNQSGVYNVSAIKAVEGNLIQLENERQINALQTEVFRFGVLTGFCGEEESRTIGYINNFLEFDITNDAVMTSKEYNAYRNDLKKRLVIYSCVGGIVTSVKYPTEEMKQRLEWQTGTVTDYSDSNEDWERVVTIQGKEDGTVKYYLPWNDNCPLRELKEKLVGRTVGVKQILCPDWNDGKSDVWETVAVDVNADEEFVKELENPVFMRIAKDSNFNAAEYTYELLKLLKGADTWQKKYVAFIFLQDFYETREIYGKLASGNEPAIKEVFEKARGRNGMYGQLIPHLMLLDKSSFEYLTGEVDFEGDAYEAFADELKKIYREIAKQDAESDEEPDVYELLARCREYYSEICDNLKKQLDRLPKEEVCSEIVRIFNETFRDKDSDKENEIFMKLLCEEDRKRIEILRRCCGNALNEASPEFQTAYSDINELCDMVEKHPTPLAAEMLSMKNVLDPAFREIDRRVGQYHADKMQPPFIMCMLNEKTGDNIEQAVITRGQENIYIIVKNGEEGEKHNPATNLKINWAIPELGLSGVEERIVSLESGKIEYFDISLGEATEKLEKEQLTFRWRVSYKYRKYNNDVVGVQKDWEEIFVSVIPADDRSAVKNPYKEAAGGGALKTAEMFFGRQRQKKELREWLVDEQGQLCPGRITVVYGQKTCGKTSLINQIQNEINDQLGDQSIVVYLGAFRYRTLETFKFDLARLIVKRMLDKINDVKNKERYSELQQNLKEKAVKAPAWKEAEWIEQFTTFFVNFNEACEGKYKLVLIMDEFTGLCVKIRDAYLNGMDYRDKLDFFRELSEEGIIQIIIGHAAMMSTLKEVNKLNELTKDALVKELSALETDEKEDLDEPKQLICEPMEEKECLGYNPYNTVLGKQAIERLRYFSGSSPSVLMKLCNEMCDYCIKEKAGRQLTVQDVELVVGRYIRKLEPNKTFDMILNEAGDSDNLTTQIETYMEYIAQCTDMATGRCRIDDEQCKAQTKLENPAAIRKLLEDRKVLSVENGYVSIIIGLYVAYIKSKTTRKETDTNE